MGRVGKELSTSRVVAGQTLLVGAANISLTPWQTNLTFVRASTLLVAAYSSSDYLPISFSLLARTLAFSLVELAVVFQSFPNLSLSLSLFLSISLAHALSFPSTWAEKKKDEKKIRRRKETKRHIPKHRHRPLPLLLPLCYRFLFLFLFSFLRSFFAL